MNCIVGENNIGAPIIRGNFVASFLVSVFASLLNSTLYSYRTFLLLKVLSFTLLFAIAFKSEKERQLLLSQYMKD